MTTEIPEPGGPDAFRALYRAGADGSAGELTSMALDGLLIQLTETAWVPSGTVVDAGMRAEALGPPPIRATVYSHATAHWLWWGSGRAPITATVTTHVRRRLRSAYPVEVYERDVDDAALAVIRDIPVTAPARTLFDEALDSHHTDPVALARLIGGLLSDVGPVDAAEFRRLVATTKRRPGMVRLRAALKLLDQPDRRGR